MKSSKKPHSNAASVTEGICVGSAKAGRDGTSSKAAKEEHQSRAALEMQPWASRVGPSAQDTSAVLLRAMEQHKHKPQAKHSGCEALFRP